MSGTVTYVDDAQAVLRVVKLGLTATTPEALGAYAAIDPPFPHHSTTRQWHTRARTAAYRDLGRGSATLLLDEIDATVR